MFVVDMIMFRSGCLIDDRDRCTILDGVVHIVTHEPGNAHVRVESSELSTGART